MRRLHYASALCLGALLLVPAAAQEGARAAQLTTQILGRATEFLPDSEVPPSRVALFRGELADVRAAIEELAALGDESVTSFARLLGSRSAHLRANAAWGLSLVGGPVTVAPLVRAAGDRQASVRYQVANSLGYTFSAAALEALNQLAGDENGEVRMIAVRTGGTLRDLLAAESATAVPDRIQALVQHAHADNVCRRLIRYGAEAVPTLIQALESPDKSIVVGAAYCLSEIGDARGLEPLWAKFEASLAGDPETKFAFYLSRFRSPEVWGYLTRLLGSANAAAQYYALERLATFEHAERVSTIHGYIDAQIAAGAHQTVIRGPQTDVNALAEACRVLGLVGDQTSVAVLDRVIGEAQSEDKSILKPIAEKAREQLVRRLG